MAQTMLNTLFEPVLLATAFPEPLCSFNVSIVAVNIV